MSASVPPTKPSHTALLQVCLCSHFIPRSTSAATAQSSQTKYQSSPKRKSESGQKASIAAMTVGNCAESTICLKRISLAMSQYSETARALGMACKNINSFAVARVASPCRRITTLHRKGTAGESQAVGALPGKNGELKPRPSKRFTAMLPISPPHSNDPPFQELWEKCIQIPRNDNRIRRAAMNMAMNPVFMARSYRMKWPRKETTAEALKNPLSRSIGQVHGPGRSKYIG